MQRSLRQDQTVLYGPFHDDNVEITELRLDAGASINDRADDGKTPLHRAAEVANMENIPLLLRTRGRFES